MKIAITADIHVGIQGKLQYTMWGLRRIRRHCIDRSIKHIIVLGDLLHDREQIGVEDLNALVEFLIETDEKYGITVITFPGNHDMYLKNSWDINSLKPLTRYLTSYHNVAKLELGGLRFWIIPFIYYESQYMKVLEAVHKRHKEGDILLTHVGVRSATLNACFMLKSWSIVDFTDSPFDRIYTGHFHVQQQVGRNVWYPGSPVPFRFDEGDTAHGFYIFDTEARDHRFIDLWEGAGDDAPPQLWTVDDSDAESISVEKVKGNIIRVALSQEWTHNDLSGIRDLLMKMGAKDVRWLNMTSKEEKQSVMAIKDAAASASELFERYVEIDTKGTKGLSTKLLLQLNASIVASGDKKYSERGIEC